MLVKSTFVERPNSNSTPPMIGVLAALARGFDRIAAHPVLILPPVVLGGFLWLGPHLGVERIFRLAAAELVGPLAADPGWQERAGVLRDTLLQFGARFNLLSLVSTFPVGIPSLMSGALPAGSPLGSPWALQLDGAGSILAAWLFLTLIGVGLGAGLHPPRAPPPPPRRDPPPA